MVRLMVGLIALFLPLLFLCTSIEAQTKAKTGKTVNPSADTRSVAEKNLKQTQDFFEENTKKPGVITLPSGLQYKIVNPGKGASPLRSDYVKLKFKATFIDGTEFDNSEKEGPPGEYQVNAVIPGWSEALQKMSPGAEWTLYIPPQLAYGEKGVPGKIGPNATLIYDLKLVEIVSKPNESVTNILENTQPETGNAEGTEE